MSFSGGDEDQRNAALDAVTAFEAANSRAAAAAQRLVEAWRLHLSGAGPEPSRDALVEVGAMQAQSQLALDRARQAAWNAHPELIGAPQAAATMESFEPVARKKSRRRRSETRFLRKLGSRGQRILRAVLLVMMLCAAMVTAAAAISLSLEVAGFLHLIDEPVQLPLGFQLAVFSSGCVVVFGLRRMLKAVERSLYGSKGRPAQAFPL